MSTATDSLKKELSLEGFIGCYVSTVFDFVKVENVGKGVAYEDFRTSVTKAVSSRLGISEEEVRNMENPFHWTFFCGNSNSPLELVSDSRPGNQKLIVRINRHYAVTPHMQEIISSKILFEYGGPGGYLEARRDGKVRLVSQASA